jgi:hypothetical protein
METIRPLNSGGAAAVGAYGHSKVPGVSGKTKDGEFGR